MVNKLSYVGNHLVVISSRQAKVSILYFSGERTTDKETKIYVYLKRLVQGIFEVLNFETIHVENY